MESGNPGWLPYSQSDPNNMQLNRWVFDGFYSAIEGASVQTSSGYETLEPGAYSSPGWWGYTAGGVIYGGAMYGQTIPNTFEWTSDSYPNGDTNTQVVGYWPSYASGECASGWTSASHYPAAFFGGQGKTADCAIAWQFIGGPNDYDQVHVSNLTSYWDNPCH